jgi:muramidase (phage lysozyme)
VARFGQHDNILDLIGAAEGTDRGRGYNETLGYGAFTGGAVNLTGMSLNEVLALQSRMLANPANSFNSSAVGRYQITRTTLLDMMKELGLTGDRLFDESTQDELARALLRRRGDNPDALRNEWEGLRQVDDSTIRNAYAGTPTAAQALPPTEAQQQQIDLAKQQADARRNLSASIQDNLDKARLEQSLAGMSASQKRVELQLFQYQQEAKRAGLTLTDEEISKMRRQLELTERLNVANQNAQASAEGMKNAEMYFAETFTQSLSGLLTGTQDLNGALKSLLNNLIDATLQAALLGKGPLAGLFGGAGSGILGAIFGFSEGGFTGVGAKHQPAGIVHKGEVVWSQRDVARAGGVDAVEIMRRGALPGFADGGYVGSAPAVLRAPELKAGNSNHAEAVQEIVVNAPITVNGSAGTPEQNNDLAQKMAKQMEQSMRGVIADEIRRQTRPGNFMNTRSR